MCGRFALDAPSKELADCFRLIREVAIEPRYNIAPSQPITIIRSGVYGHEMSSVRWGLIPHWAKDEKIGYKLINARSETIREKPTFRNAFKSRRCLIPATGFYEWTHEGGMKQPYFIRMKNSDLFAMAGIWETWQNPGGEMAESCSILTTDANSIVSAIHDRMPLILPDEQYDMWLDPRNNGNLFAELVRPYSSDEMTAYKVTNMVNNARNEGVGCIRKAGD